MASTSLPQLVMYNLPLPISADYSRSPSSCAQKCAAGGFTLQITWNSCIKKLNPTPTRNSLTTWVPPCCPFRNWQTPASTRVCGAGTSISCIKKISATFSLRLGGLLQTPTTRSLLLGSLLTLTCKVSDRLLSIMYNSRIQPALALVPFPCTSSLERLCICPLQQTSVIAHEVLAPPACFPGCIHSCSYTRGQCSFTHFYHSWGLSCSCCPSSFVFYIYLLFSL